MQHMTHSDFPDCFTRFSEPADHLALPEKFTFPFYYEPHPLSQLAAAELRQYLMHQTDWQHPFWEKTVDETEIYGKMFGVLVVQNSQQEIGYLKAFSGKVAGSYRQPGFVPPVFDLQAEAGFYRKEEEALKQMNRRILEMEQHPELTALQQLLVGETALSEQQLSLEKEKVKAGKLARQERRLAVEKTLTSNELQILESELAAESLREHYALKDLKKYWKKRLQDIQIRIAEMTTAIDVLKEERKAKSIALQQRITTEYCFLNQAGEEKSLADIFHADASNPPPGGAGECAAPKLLQYAFLHQLKPVALAEFWWGISPASEIRIHGQYYPACRGKCEPILGHMLKGMPMDENPMLQSLSHLPIETVYEDEHLLVINKPAELLSVPGRNVTDSVYSRLKKQYPNATGPMMVHRLDMSTSGLMLIAKTTEVYKKLQRQFLFRTVKKRYVALLAGIIEGEEGVIDLPLRVDLDDRPRQLVCYEHGKAAFTEWRVISRANGQTRIHFFPQTGRTHQLRVHAAHHLGLNTPILGDDIYGNKAERLYLHAEYIEFVHPVSGEELSVHVAAEF